MDLSLGSAEVLRLVRPVHRIGFIELDLRWSVVQLVPGIFGIFSPKGGKTRGRCEW